MPRLKKIITIDNDIVLSRKKTFFHDAEYEKKRKYRRVAIYRIDGTLLKTEQIGRNYPWSYNYRTIEEYDENENVVKTVKYNDDSRSIPDYTEINEYNSDGRLVESTVILKESKYVYHYQYREWEDDGWKHSEWIISWDEYRLLGYNSWKIVKTCIETKETNAISPDRSVSRKDFYKYQNGSWKYNAEKSYSIYYNIEGYKMKKVFVNGDIYFYEDYNSYGDYKTYRVKRSDGASAIFTYSYRYDAYGKMLLQESFKDGIKQWEKVREIEYW